MKKNKLINLRISEEEHSKYVKLAKNKKIDLSKLIRDLLEKELIQNGYCKN